jgi:hypothetical protein
VLREFAEQLRGPVTASMYVRYETPDGPMHVFEPIELMPWCPNCGEDFGECECLD